MNPLLRLFAAFSLLTFSLNGQEGVQSFYSTTAAEFSALVESSEFEKEPEIDHFCYIAPGYGGYEVLYEGGDARSWINVRHKGVESDLYVETMRHARGMFPAKANDVVEWRGRVKDGNFSPYAIIYRIVATDPEDEKKDLSTLLVIGLSDGKAVFLGAAHGADEDARAKAIADAWAKKQ